MDQFRLLYMGAPKSGKTGSLAALANAGWTIRYIDFDANVSPLLNFTDTPNRKNIQIVRCIDNYTTRRVPGKKDNTFDEVYVYKEKPAAWTTMNDNIFKQWVVDGSNPAEWDPTKNVIVIDSLSTLSQARLRLSQYTAGREGGKRAYTDFGAAQQHIEDLLHSMKGTIMCPVIIVAHIDVIGPDLHTDDVESDELKEALLRHKLKGAEKTPWAIGPVTVGKALLRNLAMHFSGVVLAESSKTFGRQIHLAPRDGLGLGVPIPKMPKELPIETGMASIMNSWVKVSRTS